MIDTEIEIQAAVKETLSGKVWRTCQAGHHQLIDEVIDPYLKKKQHQHKDPVLDFLFEYYAFRPSHLKRWSPGIGILLEEATCETAPPISELTITDKGAFLNPSHFPKNRKSSAQWILSLLKKSMEKAPSFGCFGMHEWAMVYKADTIRHSYLSLRMDDQELAEFVESRPLVCTHFDAFRFFTKPAKPLNKFALSRQDFHETEQAGCLHTNMDLYKWAFKLFPWVSSDIIREAFFLAVDTRRIDMKASPYDLQEYDLQPIKIETDDGRKEYIIRQKEMYRRSVPVRKKLVAAYQKLISSF